MADQEAVTFVKNAIHRPDEPRHFMRLKQPGKLVTVTKNGVEVARSTKAIKLQEAGFDLYDPVYYFPKEDVNTALLDTTDLTTHCPLKGDTAYYNVKVNGETLDNAAFSYVSTFDYGEALKDLIAFDPNKLQVIEHIEEA